MTRLALYLQDAHPIPEAIEFSRYAEEKGFDAVWQADSRLVREASVPMAAFAATTDRIKIGSGVIDVWTRNPARLASMFATLDDLAPGRILAGLGAWWTHYQEADHTERTSMANALLKSNPRKKRRWLKPNDGKTEA